MTVVAFESSRLSHTSDTATQSQKIAMDFTLRLKSGLMSFVSGAPYWIEESGTRIEIRYRNWQAMVFGTLLVGAAILCGLLFHSRIPPVFQGLFAVCTAGAVLGLAYLLSRREVLELDLVSRSFSYEEGGPFRTSKFTGAFNNIPGIYFDYLPALQRGDSPTYSVLLRLAGEKDVWIPLLRTRYEPRAATAWRDWGLKLGLPLIHRSKDQAQKS